MKKEESHLRSIFKDAKKYSDELNMECEFDDGATILRSSDKEIHVSDIEKTAESKEHYKQSRYRQIHERCTLE